MLHCETVGELREALAALPDGAALRVEYDGGSGGSSSVAVLGVATKPDEPWEPWGRAGDAVLSIDYDLSACDNVVTTVHQCVECSLKSRTYTVRDSGVVIEDELRDGLTPGHVRGEMGSGGRCPGAGLPPRPMEGGA